MELPFGPQWPPEDFGKAAALADEALQCCEAGNREAAQQAFDRAYAIWAQTAEAELGRRCGINIKKSGHSESILILCFGVAKRVSLLDS